MKLSAILNDMGYCQNPYGWCFINNITNGGKRIILWHVEDLNISHVEPDIVSEILKDIKKQYRHIAPLVITCENIHDCVEMMTDFLLQERQNSLWLITLGKCWMFNIRYEGRVRNYRFTSSF